MQANCINVCKVSREGRTTPKSPSFWRTKSNFFVDFISIDPIHRAAAAQRSLSLALGLAGALVDSDIQDELGKQS